VHGCTGAQVPVHRFTGTQVHGFWRNGFPKNHLSTMNLCTREPEPEHPCTREPEN